ncbi:MAG: sugar phosphate nucleotidyltransferase [Flavobacteriales bacterium]|nr:sugar phosphate nucleotidyltransferase [Flavobacteriales bacterium]
MNTLPQLVIMAAGMGSRYGGIKQIDAFGPHGETLMDFSVFDALRAGFGEVIFIIRKEIEQDFRDVVLKRMEGRVPYRLCFQEMEPDIPGLGRVARTKPWGTCHAVISAAPLIDRPFVVINADDFYGRSAFEVMRRFFDSSKSETDHAMAGYRLGDTLSDYGTVSRGVCEATPDNVLISITEHTQIRRGEGCALSLTSEGEEVLPLNRFVSMNFWGFKPSILPVMESLFYDFAKANQSQPKAEFYIPLAVDHVIKNLGHRVHILPCEGPWFGVTYREDRPQVLKAVQKLVQQGVYPEGLFN